MGRGTSDLELEAKRVDLKIKGKCALVTGGSRGTGRAVVELLAAEGARVAFFSRVEEQVRETERKVRAAGGFCQGSVVEMEDQDAYVAWLHSAVSSIGGCDIFIHNASASGSRATQDWERNLRIDVLGAVTGIEHLTSALSEGDGGAVVLMASTAALETFSRPQAFNALKAAIITYGKQVSQVLGPKRIRVNTVSPGPVFFPGGNWEFIQQTMPDRYSATLAQIPLGRFGATEDVARAVVFLASPAANFITGTNLVIDGGFTKRVQF